MHLFLLIAMVTVVVFAVVCWHNDMKYRRSVQKHLNEVSDILKTYNERLFSLSKELEQLQDIVRGKGVYLNGDYTVNNGTIGMQDT